MKSKLGNEEMLREMHEKYERGFSEDRLKNWWFSVRTEKSDATPIFEPSKTHLENLRRDFDLAVESNSLENAPLLQQWFKSETFLPRPSLGLIHKFLWASKEDPEKCKKKLQRFYALRGTDDELFGNRDPSSPQAKQVNRSSYFVCLPGFTPEFYRVTVSVLKDVNPESFVTRDWMKRFFYLADLRVRDDFCLGDIMIFDLKGFSLQHLLKFPLPLAKKMVVATEGALPTRIKQIHMINSPPFVDKITALFKPFLKEKIAKRIYIHSENLEQLYQFVPKEMLPNEYGGKAGTFKELNDYWANEAENNREWFLKEEKNIKRIYLEAKKEGKLFMDSGDLFGMEGSFKKLTID